MQNLKDTIIAPEAAPLPVDYATLEARVSQWQANFVQQMREDYSAVEAEKAARELNAKPWLALKWFLEDSMPVEQSAKASIQ